MRNFLDGAKDGAVVISLGTNVAWKGIGMDKLKIVITALSKVKQRVLWKLKIDVPLEMPSNVMAVEWMPQGDVLSMFINSFENTKSKRLYMQLYIFFITIISFQLVIVCFVYYIY